MISLNFNINIYQIQQDRMQNSNFMVLYSCCLLYTSKRGHRVFENAAFVSEVDKWLNELNYSGYIGKPCKFSSDYQWYDGRK